MPGNDNQARAPMDRRSACHRQWQPPIDLAPTFTHRGKRAGLARGETSIDVPLMLPTDRFEKVEVENLAQLRNWLAANHDREEGVWLLTYMRVVPDKFVDRWDVLDELLCFGWTDGLRRKLDGTRTMQLISPRRQQAWAQSYKDRVARLEAEGRIAAPGRAAIERAKALGLWDAYAQVDALAVPDDLRAALRAQPPAEQSFEAAAPSYRRNVLRWIAAAKKPETRARRIAELASQAAFDRRVPQM
jgi:uncharacterized protein YdeI (YjbR/CyaY-like superfamily)